MLFQNDSLVISQARQYLESQSLDNTTDSLSLSVITYALVLSKSEKAVSWLAKLRSVSSNEEGDFGWTRGAGRGEWIYEDQMLIPNDNENSRGKENCSFSSRKDLRDKYEEKKKNKLV